MPRFDNLGLGWLVLTATACAASARAPRPSTEDAAAATPSPDVAVMPADVTAAPVVDAARPPLDAGPVPDAGQAPPDVAAPVDVALGPFPLAAVQAAKPELYAGIVAHNEGPSWRDGDLFFAADGVGLMRADAQGKVFKYHPTLNPIGSLTLADGTLLLCDKKHVLLQMFRDGQLGVLVGEGGGAMFCNDVTVDADGNIYFSDSRARAIMRLTPGGALTRAADAPGNYPNGVEVDPTNKQLYFSDTSVNALFRAPLTGTGLGPVERIGPMICDGMAFDAWGNLWLAQVTAGEAVVFDPLKRQMIARVNMGGPEATNLTFGGPGRDILFTTVANKGVMRVPVGVRGFSHPGAAKYVVRSMLDVMPANTPN